MMLGGGSDSQLPVCDQEGEQSVHQQTSVLPFQYSVQ